MVNITLPIFQLEMEERHREADLIQQTTYVETKRKSKRHAVDRKDKER